MQYALAGHHGEVFAQLVVRKNVNSGEIFLIEGDPPVPVIVPAIDLLLQ